MGEYRSAVEVLKEAARHYGSGPGPFPFCGLLSPAITEVDALVALGEFDEARACLIGDSGVAKS